MDMPLTFASATIRDSNTVWLSAGLYIRGVLFVTQE